MQVFSESGIIAFQFASIGMQRKKAVRIMPAPQIATRVMRTLICQWKLLEWCENSRRYCMRIDSLTKVMQAGYRKEPVYWT